MYIEKYWGDYIGGSDDSLNLLVFLKDQKEDEITLSEIFSRIGLDRQNWNFRQTVNNLAFTHSNGIEIDFHFAIDLITDIATLLLECLVNDGINLYDLEEYDTPTRYIRIVAKSEEYKALDTVLMDFTNNPLSYDLSELIGEHEIKELAHQVEKVRKDLYLYKTIE